MGLKAFTSEIRHEPWVGRRSGPERKVWGHRTQHHSRPTLLVLQGFSGDLPSWGYPDAAPPEQGLKSKNIHSQRSPNTTENSSHSTFTSCVQVSKMPQEAPRPYAELTCSPRSP